MRIPFLFLAWDDVFPDEGSFLTWAWSATRARRALVRRSGAEPGDFGVVSVHHDVLWIRILAIFSEWARAKVRAADRELRADREAFRREVRKHSEGGGE